MMMTAFAKLFEDTARDTAIFHPKIKLNGHTLILEGTISLLFLAGKPGSSSRLATFFTPSDLTRYDLWSNQKV